MKNEDKIKGKNIEELTVLLSMLKIKNINNYLNNNCYLKKYCIYDLAYMIMETFNQKRDFNLTKDTLTKNKYAIINKKEDDYNDLF